MARAKTLQAAAEAILFSVGEPLEILRLAEALEIDEELTEQVLLNLSDALDARGSGVCLLNHGSQYPPAPRPVIAHQIR